MQSVNGDGSRAPDDPPHPTQHSKPHLNNAIKPLLRGRGPKRIINMDKCHGARPLGDPAASLSHLFTTVISAARQYTHTSTHTHTHALAQCAQSLLSFRTLFLSLNGAVEYFRSRRHLENIVPWRSGPHPLRVTAQSSGCYSTLLLQWGGASSTAPRWETSSALPVSCSVGSF